LFVFVVPLIGKESCSDWSVVSRLCRQSIRSMLAGLSEGRVILACNEPPESLSSDPRLIVHTMPYVSRPNAFFDKTVDKYLKLKAGLIVARQFTPTWLMRADADDLISNKLVPFVERQDPRTAWYSAVGWAHIDQSRWVTKFRDFHLLCGTSCVTHVTKDDLPDTMMRPDSEFYLLTQGHNIIVEYLRNSAITTRPVPFPTTIYVTDSGENISGPWLTKLKSRRMRVKTALNTRYLSRSIGSEFGLSTTI